MARAAVPDYIQADFREAAPGHRFELYFPVWTLDSSRPAGRPLVDTQAKQPALEKTLGLTGNDKQTLGALAARQRQLANDRIFQLAARTVAPLTTGLGMEHPMENGFAFLKPYGLPYLPGSGVKGVLRAAARELVEDEPAETRWTHDHIAALFGHESDDDPRRGALIFWDVFPELQDSGGTLAMEVMTPHHSQYYQGKAAPHDSEDPNPILFLAIPANTPLVFHVACRHTLLPNALAEDGWQALLQEAFEHAFDWVGFGAKTAVGYGQLAVDDKRQRGWNEDRAERLQAEAAEAALAEATAGLPEDAAELMQRRERSTNWADNGEFLAELEAWLEGLGSDKLSAQAVEIAGAELESRYKGILANPDATQGKKKKPKYGDRQKNLVKRLRAMQPPQAES